MKLYKTAYIDDAPPEGFTPYGIAWDGTQADAAKRRKALRIDGMREVETDEENVPIDKSGLLGWLNIHLV